VLLVFNLCVVKFNFVMSVDEDLRTEAYNVFVSVYSPELILKLDYTELY